MADNKKDFLSELAKEVDQKKHGERISIDSVDDFVPENKTRKATEYDRENDYPDETAEQPVKKPAEKPPVFQKPAEPEEPKQETEETETEDEYGEDGNPDSFDEEDRQKVVKPKVHIKKSWIILGVLAACGLGFLIWYLNFAPKITLPDFVGKTTDDVSTWAKQNKMESGVIATSEEYNFDNDSGVVLSQSVKAGTKVKTSTIITFTVSKGADPDEVISFPDIKNMTQDEITEWISTNKLAKTKVTTQYSTTVASGSVISYDLKSVSENNFTRGTSLSIVCSKGPEPAGQITAEDFTNKTFAEAQVWANTKKVVANKTEDYSDTITSGNVISQSIKSGTSMSQGDTITFVVSKGKGVVIPNLVGYTKEELTAWQANADNSVTVVTSSVYSMELEGTVVGQDVQAGTKVDSGSVLTLKISLYMPIMETTSREWLGVDYLKLNAWCDGVNAKGADIQAVGTETDGTAEFPTEGMIISYSCEGSLSSSDKADSCGRPLNTNARISYTYVGKGRGYSPSPSPETEKKSLTLKTGTAGDSYSTFKIKCTANNITITPDGTVADTSTLCDSETATGCVAIFDSNYSKQITSGTLTEGDSIIVKAK